MDPCAHSVRFGVVTVEQFDVPVHVGEGLASFRRRRDDVGVRPLAQVVGVVGVQFGGGGVVRQGLIVPPEVHIRCGMGLVEAGDVGSMRIASS